MRTYLYAALAVAFLAVSGRLLLAYNSESAPAVDAFWATVQPISFEEAKTTRAALLDIATKPLNEPETYYTRVIAPVDVLEQRIERTLRDRWRTTENWAGLNAIWGSTNSIKQTAQESYSRKYGREFMADAGKSFRQTYKRAGPVMPDVGPYLRRWYLISMLLAAFFFVLRVRGRGLALWVEILQPHQYLLAVIAWPVFVWKYPMHTPANQMRWALRYATLVLGTLLSGGAGVAKAADTGKDTGKRERKGKWSLQLDVRASDAVSGSSTPEFLGKATLAMPSGPFLESTSVIRKDFWLASEIIGIPVAKPKGFVINAVGGVIATSAGNRSVTAGYKIFGGGKYWGMGMPACGVERQWSPQWVTTWTAAAQLFAKPTTRLRVGFEGSVRKIPGAKSNWYAGGLVGWSFGKGKPAVEGLLLHNSAGAERARIRVTHAFAF